jgi:hypothetical protein
MEDPPPKLLAWPAEEDVEVEYYTLGLTRLHGLIRVKRSGTTKGVEDGQVGQALLARVQGGSR